jgi:hypothetical protein
MEGKVQALTRAALRKGQPNSRNLSAFAMDAGAYLDQTGLFTKYSWPRCQDHATTKTR